MLNITWLLSSPESATLATWIIAISLVVSTILSVLAFTGYAQAIQIRFLKSQIESRLRVLESYVASARKRVENFLAEQGVKEPKELVEPAMSFFVVEPVSIEPVDIIKRMERILRTGEEWFDTLVEKSVRATQALKQIASTSLLILNALNTIYMYVKHLLITGIKTRNALLIAQLWAILPMLMRIAKAYYDALPGILEGKPIGDSLGPLVAYRLMEILKAVNVREIEKDTIVASAEYDGRFIYIVKAKGPGSTVGRPGVAVEKLAHELGKVSMIVTVDAALKFEGEPTGKISEGVGAAIGDPGPEKIRIERTAVENKAPLYAIVVKMGLEESIQPMVKEIADAADRVVERILKLVREKTSPGDTIIIVGVGNTIGVGQP